MISSSTGSSGCSGSTTACLDDENMSDDRPMKRKRLSSSDSLKTNFEHSESKINPFSEGNRGDTLVTEKRLRKPPRRYSEESVEQKSRSNSKKSALKASKDKSFHSESHKQQWQKKVKAAPIVHKDKSFNGGCIQVPFGLPIEEGHSAKKRTCWVRIVPVRKFVFIYNVFLLSKFLRHGKSLWNIEMKYAVPNSAAIHNLGYIISIELAITLIRSRRRSRTIEYCA